MSDDTHNELDFPTLKKPEHVKPRLFIHRPVSTEEEAEEASKQVSYVDAARSIKLEDFSNVHHTPCFRNAMLPGIAGGMGVGAIRFLIGANAMAAANWAVGGFAGIAFVTHGFCQRRRSLEKEGIRRAVEVLDKKDAFKEASKAQMDIPKVTEPQEPPKQGNNFWSTFKFW